MFNTPLVKVELEPERFTRCNDCSEEGQFIVDIMSKKGPTQIRLCWRHHNAWKKAQKEQGNWKSASKPFHT